MVRGCVIAVSSLLHDDLAGHVEHYAGLRPHAVIIGASMRSRSPRARFPRCLSISSGVANSAASS